MPESETTLQPHKIAVIAWGLFGDTLLRTPLFRALRVRYPNAHICAIVTPVGHTLVRNNPDIDNVYVFRKNKQSKLAYLRHVWQSLTWLRREKFDCIIDSYHGGSSWLWLGFSGAPMRISFDHLPKLRVVTTHLIPYPGFCDHWGRDLARLLAPLGIHVDKCFEQLSFYPSPTGEEKKYCDDLFTGSKAPIVINLVTAATEKNWSIANFVTLVRHIDNTYHYPIIILQNPDMEYVAADCIKQCQKLRVPVTLAPLLSLDGLGYFLGKAAMLISGDTGIMHLGVAMKTPTLALFTYTRPEWVSPSVPWFVASFREETGQVGKCGKPILRELEPEEVIADFEKITQRIIQL
jgi:heptosyltransferase I